MKKIMSIIACLSLVTVIFLPTAVFGKPEGLAEKIVAPESYIFSSGNRETIRLSPQEKTFIKNHPVIKVSNELDYPPFDFAIEGQPQGYTIDLLGLLAKKIGIRIEFINGYTWDEIVQLFRERKIDLLHSLVKTPERSKFMLFSDRFFRDRQMYITRKDNPDITDVTQLYGKTISQGKNWSTVELLRANYPQIPLLIVDNLEEMLSAVAYGKVDATIADEAAATYMIKQKGMSDLKLSGWARELDQLVGLNFHFAGQMDAPELISMLNKALASLTAEELDGLKRKWFGGEPVAISLTREEEAFLKNHPVITASNEQKWAPFNFFEDGQPKGFSIDYLNLLADKAGFTVKYVSGPSWKEFVELTKNKKIDVLLNTAYSEERTAWFEFLQHPYFDVHYGLVVNTARTDIKGFKDILDKRIAVEDGFWMQRWFSENHPEARLIPYKNTLEALAAVSINEADVYVGNVSVGGYLLNKHWLTNLQVVPLGATTLKKGNDLYICLPKGMTVLKSILDKAMAAVTDEEMNRLAAKWVLQGMENSSRVAEAAGISFSKNEQAYLRETDEITYCVDPDWMPLERINKQGRHEGMAADLIREVEKRIGIPFHLVATRSWSDSLAAVRDGRCRILSAAAATGHRREYLDFTEPYGEYPLVVAVSNEELFVENLEAIRDKTLGVVKGYAHADLIRERYPNFRIVEVDNVQDGLERVQSHEIFGFVDTAPTIGYQLRRRDIRNLKIGGKLDIPLKLSFAVRKGAPPELLRILDKALNSFSEEEKKVLADKWFSIKIEKVFDYTRFWQVLGVAMAIFILILFWNRKLARLNRSLQEARRVADEANQAKSAFFANMSHELRTPLNVMLGFSQLLARSSNLSSEQRASLKSIGRSGEHLLELINDVLEFSKIEEGKIELKREAFDLSDFLLGLEEMFRLRANQQWLDLKFIIDDEVPIHIRADKNKLRQVLINLLGNAVKFTAQGEVTLHVRTETEESSCRLRFTVSDTGIGIAPEDQERIFDAFYQTGGDQLSVKGTGLGLTISHKFVKLMGGKLEVESGLGRGSRFSFDLPIEPAEAEETEAARSKGRVIGLVPEEPECRLLVAEDDPGNRIFLCTLLRSVGFAVREAANGREAVEIWRQWQPQVIWMDIRMPEMDGLSAIREIRRLPGGEQTVIVGLTAFAFKEDRRNIIANGGDDFIHKPYTEEEIFSCLEKHLGVRFQYAEEDQHPSGGTGPDRLERNEVAALLEDLPEELLFRFDEAVRQSDVAGIEQGIEEICQVAPRLGPFFQKLAADFAYEEIVAYLDEEGC